LCHGGILQLELGQFDRAQGALEAQELLDCFDERGQARELLQGPQELQARPRAGLDL
jgi:hypothetical protein